MKTAYGPVLDIDSGVNETTRGGVTLVLKGYERRKPGRFRLPCNILAILQNVCDISVNYEFQINCMQKISVIAKTSFLERSVVTLKLRKEYLNTVTHNTSVLLWIKTEQFDV